jgi:hypothetical protein
LALLYDEAVEIVSRPHNAAKQMLAAMVLASIRKT